MSDIKILDFDDKDVTDNIIKVIGVGGGGGNAVNHMYREGIHDVNFVVANTDAQALNTSPVPVHLQLGKEGLGAGNKPEKGRLAAEETVESIKKMLDDGTKMSFITAGMGGGTGTGAAPVIAKVSKDLGILTVGIVTIPFKFEGRRKIDQALDGVEEMAKHVDALLVINNERLRKVYPDLSLMEAFKKADDTLSVAAKSIADIITTQGFINLDFEDVQTTMKDGGVAIMSTGFGEGEGRITKAIQNALHSPLLSNNEIYRSKRILISISFQADNNENQGVSIEEMGEINEFMESFKENFELKWGVFLDPELDKKVKVTILATGFGLHDVDSDELQQHLDDAEAARIAQSKEDEADRTDRRNRYYGDGDDTVVKSHPRVYLFSEDDLDNDDVILAVESIPTYKRTKQRLEEIRKISTPKAIKEETAPQAPINGVISFDMNS